MANNKDIKSQQTNDIEDLKSVANKTLDNDVIPEDILKDIPEEDRGKFVRVINRSMVSGIMSRGNPISEKITEEHITKLIDKSDNRDIRDREERKSLRNYNLILVLIGLAFLGFLVVYLKDNTELLYQIIIALFSFLGGFGFGKTKSKKEE